MNKMDQWKHTDLSKTTSAAMDSAPPHSQLTATVTSNSTRFHDPRQRGEVEAQDPTVARKVQKADREKLRRDRLNEHFHDLASTLDSDRPRNDKATILTDTIQILKDLSAEVNRLKTEHRVLSQESRELMQEKNELREEKASLKSDIDNLNAQYHQRVRIMFPWTAIDHSAVMAPPYSYPIPVPISPALMSIHPTLQPFPFFGNQNPAHIPTPCSNYVQFSAPANPSVELQSTQYASSSHVPSQKESHSKSPHGHRRIIDADRCSQYHDVATELELKMPGSSTQEDSTSAGRKGKHSVRKDRIIPDGSASSWYSPSQGLHDSSNSVGNDPKADI